MKTTNPSELQATLESYREGTKHINNENFNPFKEDFHAKLLYLIDRQAGMQQAEIWQFFRPYPNKIKPKGDQQSELYYYTNNHDKQDFQTYRTRRMAEQTVNKYLIKLEELGYIKKEIKLNKPITFNPLTNEILPYEITPTGKNDSERKVNRYYLTEPLFILLARAFKIEDYFTGQVNFEKNKIGMQKFNELAKKDLENQATSNDISKILKINNSQLKEFNYNPNVGAQLRKMQNFIDVCQKKTRKDFLEKLTQDFEEYCSPIRTLQKPLENIYTKQLLGINYFALLNNFLSERFNFEWNKILTAYLVKTKRYNYAETFLIGYTKNISNYEETGLLLNNTELKRLQQTWTKRDGSKTNIDLQYLKMLETKADIKGNTKHMVPNRIR